MVEPEIRDGVRIVELLAAELDGHADPPLGLLSIGDADPDAAGTPQGDRAYDVPCDDADADRDDDSDATNDGDVVARVYVHEDRVHIEFRTDLDVAAETARERGLRTRPKATRSPRLLVFVERGAEVKDALRVFAAVVAADS